MAKILFYLIALFPIFIHADPRTEYLQSDLDTYVHSDDASFKYVVKQVKEFDDWKNASKERQAQEKAKADQAIKKNKQKLGFLKKHKPKKK